MSKIHTLKTWPVYFKAIVDGVKTFECRKNDRDFKVGDCLVLQEFNNDSLSYTGEMVMKEITYILHGGSFGIEQGYVVLGLGELEFQEACKECHGTCFTET
jgi:hypothetical protein